MSPRKTSRKYQHRMGGVQEADLLALACSQPLKGHRRWSLHLLASAMIRLEYIEDVSHATVRHVMQDNDSGTVEINIRLADYEKFENICQEI